MSDPRAKNVLFHTCGKQEVLKTYNRNILLMLIAQCESSKVHTCFILKERAFCSFQHHHMVHCVHSILSRPVAHQHSRGVQMLVISFDIKAILFPWAPWHFTEFKWGFVPMCSDVIASSPAVVGFIVYVDILWCCRCYIWCNVFVHMITFRIKKEYREIMEGSLLDKYHVLYVLTYIHICTFDSYCTERNEPLISLAHSGTHSIC